MGNPGKQAATVRSGLRGRQPRQWARHHLHPGSRRPLRYLRHLRRPPSHRSSSRRRYSRDSLASDRSLQQRYRPPRVRLRLPLPCHAGGDGATHCWCQVGQCRWWRPMRCQRSHSSRIWPCR